MLPRVSLPRLASVALALVVAACAAPPGTEAQGSTAAAVSVNSEKVEGKFFLTTFGGPEDSGDNGQLACGGTSNPTSSNPHQRYYAAAKQRFGCGTHIRVEANGKCIILETTDTGPAAWVEDKAGGPVLDATPLAAQTLFGADSFGWSDRKAVNLTIADASSQLGPCDGSTDNGGSTTKPDPTGTGGDDDDSTTTPGGDDDDSTVTPTPTPTPTTTTPIPSPPDPVCQPKSAATLCKAARVACGTITDNCGGPLDCSVVPGFTCTTGSCVQNQCTGAPACQPKSAADACGAAQSSTGLQCGAVSDGCGGTVNCDTQQGFGCPDGQTCSKNQCSKAAPASSAAPTSSGGAAKTPPGTTTTTTTTTGGGDGNSSDSSDDKNPNSSSSESTPGAGPAAKGSAGGCSAAPTPGSAGSPPSFGLVGILGALALRRRRQRAARRAT
jgi:MYXO-CTERM domain-containing protein